jgi:hypothetical protein
VFTDLEKKVMAFLLEEPPDTFIVRADRRIAIETVHSLREQWSQASLLKREWTGSGFFTYFQLSDAIATLKPANFIVDIAKAQIAGLEAPAEFILWIENGRLSYLEGFAYEEWDESKQVLRIFKGD